MFIFSSASGGPFIVSMVRARLERVVASHRGAMFVLHFS